MATLPDGTPIPPIPNFPPPPPPSSIGRKRQRGGNSTRRTPTKPAPAPVSSTPASATANHLDDDDEPNYVVYPSDDDEFPGMPSERTEHEEEEQVEGHGSDTETPRPRRNAHGKQDDDYIMSESDVSEDTEQPRRKKTRGNYNDGEDDDDEDMEDSSLDNITPRAAGNGTKGRRPANKWREDTYKPPVDDSDDSDLNLEDPTPSRKGRKRSVGKTGGSLAGRKSTITAIPSTNGLSINKSKSVPNLKAGGPNKIRKSKFYEGSMGDRTSRPGGVPPFVNYESIEGDGGADITADRQESRSALDDSQAMPPPPRPPGMALKPIPQSTPPPPSKKFTFFAPISNWFSKRWQKATQEYEEKERKAKEEVEIQRQVRIVMERKQRAEKVYAEYKAKGINQPRLVGPVDQSIRQEPLVTEEQVVQYMDPVNGESTGEEIGVAYTTDDVYMAPSSLDANGSRISLATIRPQSRGLHGSGFASPRTSDELPGDLSRASMPNMSGLYSQYRDPNDSLRDSTPLTGFDTATNSDVEGLGNRDQSPAPPTPVRAMTKAEQKKLQRLDKKMEDLKKKLAETEMERSSFVGSPTPTPAPPSVIIVDASPVVMPPPPLPAGKGGKSAAAAASGTKSSSAAGDDSTIVIHRDTASELSEDEAEKIVESVMGEPELMASVRARSRSKSPFRALLGFGKKDSSTTTAAGKKGKGAAAANKEAAATTTTLHGVNESGKIRKTPTRGRGGGGRGGKAGVGRKGGD